LYLSINSLDRLSISSKYLKKIQQNLQKSLRIVTLKEPHPMTLGDRLFDFWPWWIKHGDQANKNQILL
jgi:hypothetical protein